jgi:hypothetical protein
MKLYIASWFGNKTKLKKKVKLLNRNGIEVTSRWLDENVAQTAGIKDVTMNHLVTTSIIDIEDIDAADAVVLVTPKKKDLKGVRKAAWARGGRHFETGYQYALIKHLYPDKRLIILGDKENVFHYLPEVEHVKSWKGLVESLVS